MTERHFIRCDDPLCEKPIAEIREGTLRILARHHGKWHLTAFTIRQVERLLDQMRESEREAA